MTTIEPHEPESSDASRMSEPAKGRQPIPTGHRHPTRTSHWTDSVDSTRSSLLVFLVFAFLTCLLRVGATGLISMEGIVVDGARAMIESGEWSVPFVYGELYTYKPSFVYWLVAVPLLLTDAPTELMIRLPAALSGVLLGLLVLLMVGRTLSPRVGLLASMATLGVPLFVEKVRIAEFDTILTSAVGIAITAACCNLARKKESTGLWAVTYLSLAAGFLSKGIPALMIFGPGLLLASVLSGSWRRLLGSRHLIGCLFFLVPVLAYLLWAVDSMGTAVFDQPWSEGRCRGLAWTPFTFSQTLAKPIFILVAFLPWSLVLFLFRRSLPGVGDRAKGLVFSACGFLLGGTFAFMIVPTHVMRYYLPLCTAHALIVAVILEANLKRSAPRALLITLRSLLVLCTAAAIVTASYYALPGWLLSIVGVAVVTAIAMLRQRSLGTTVVTLLVAISIVVAIAQAMTLVPRRGLKRDLSSVAEELRSLVPEGEVVYVLGPSDYASKHASLYYYLDRPVRTFDIDQLPPSGSLLLRIEDTTERSPLPIGYDELKKETHHGKVFRLIRHADANRALASESLTQLFPETLGTHSPGCQRRSALRRSD